MITAKDKSQKMTADELKQWLEHFDMSHDELAQTLSITTPAIHHWLTARRDIPPTTVRLLRFFLKHPQLIGDF